MISTEAFFEELVKIGEAKEDRNITKEKFKRFLLTAAATAAGSGLGYGVGELIHRNVHGSGVLNRLPPWAVKSLPAVAGGLAAGLPMLQAMHRRKVNEYIQHGDPK